MAEPIISAGIQRAYQAAKAIPATPAAEPAAPAGASFTDVLARTAAETVETVRQGDRAAVAGLSVPCPCSRWSRRRWRWNRRCR